MLVILFLVIACLAIGLGLHYKRRRDVKLKSRSRHDLLMTSPGDKPGGGGDPYLELAAKQQSDYMPPQYSEIASDHYGSHRAAAAAGRPPKFGHRWVAYHFHSESEFCVAVSRKKKPENLFQV